MTLSFPRQPRVLWEQDVGRAGPQSQGLQRPGKVGWWFGHAGWYLPAWLWKAWKAPVFLRVHLCVLMCTLMHTVCVLTLIKNLKHLWMKPNFSGCRNSVVRSGWAYASHYQLMPCDSAAIGLLARFCWGELDPSKEWGCFVSLSQALVISLPQMAS